MESIQRLDDVPREEFQAILEYLKEHPIPKTKYRTKVGDGRSGTFGIVSRRCLAPDLSRHSCDHVELFSMLVAYGKKFVPIPYSSIQVNQSYNCKPHKDLHNHGQSYIVGFGEYTGGSLVIEGKPYDIQYRPLLFDGSQLMHSTTPFEGNRISIVYHTIAPSSRFPILPSISDYEFINDGGVDKIRHTATGTLLWKKRHPEHYFTGRAKVKKE